MPGWKKDAEALREAVIAVEEAVKSHLDAVARTPDVTLHYVCAKGNDHWLSNLVTSDGFVGDRSDGCYFHVEAEGGHTVHLTVLPDREPE